MTGVPTPDGDGAKPEYVGIPGETDRDAATARTIAREIATMPPGSFAHPDDPNAYAEDHGNDPPPEPGSGRKLDDRQPPDVPTGVAAEVEDLLREREGLAGISLQLRRMNKDIHDRFDELTAPRGRPPDLTTIGLVRLRDLAIEQAGRLVRGEISLQGFTAEMERAARKATENVKKGRGAAFPIATARQGRGREKKGG